MKILNPHLALLSLTLFIFCSAGPVYAQQKQQTITLKDGTSLKGHLVNVSGDTYVIESSTMGKVQVPVSQIVSISNAEQDQSLPIGAAGKISESALNSVKTNIMQDPQIMALIQELIQDPEIAGLMSNPSIMQDALSMDPQRIQSNPDVQKLMQHPTFQKIIALTAGKLQNQ